MCEDVCGKRRDGNNFLKGLKRLKTFRLRYDEPAMLLDWDDDDDYDSDAICCVVNEGYKQR